jgi:raffinose/stachyose/melibiose transport system permease protein
MGITMVIFIAGLQTIPAELYESARIDGANGRQLFRHITWPMLTPSVSTNLLLNIIGSLQAWQLFLVLIGYRNGTQVLGYIVYAQGFSQTTGSLTGGAMRQGYAAAASIILFFIVLVIGLSSQFVLRRREERILG